MSISSNDITTANNAANTNNSPAISGTTTAEATAAALRLLHAQAAAASVTTPANVNATSSPHRHPGSPAPMATDCGAAANSMIGASARGGGGDHPAGTLFNNKIACV